jgi:limonene-1,2-epoxide hydrolase
VNENERVVRQYFDAWGKVPAADLADYFTEDAIYCDELGGEPIRGREAIRADLVGADARSGGPVDFGLELLRVVAEGDIVMTERAEWFGRGEQRREFRAVAVFELEDGRIKESRCYFDRDPSLPVPT